MSAKSAALRRALAGDAPVLAVGAHDGLGARLVERAGFHAVWASGLEISASAGLPDAGLLGVESLLAAAVEMDLACALPVIADCDTGFGNSNNVMHLMRRYGAAGIAAVCIEDKRTPKLNSFVRGRQELAGLAEFVGKLLAAQAARGPDGPLLIARTEALIAGAGLEEALSRAEAYRRAGADVVLIHSRQPDPGEVLAFLRRWERRCPVAVVPTTYPALTADELGAAGAALVIYANQGLRARVAATERVLEQIAANRSTAAVESAIAPLARVFELSGMTDLARAEARFLRGEGRPVRVVIPAGGDLGLPPDLAALTSGPGSRAFLDLCGKPLVQHQVEAFAAAGIHDVALVGPFERAAVDVPGLSLVTTRETSLLATLRAGWSATECPSGGAVVVCYSDLLFGRHVVERLLSCPADIVVLADRGFLQAPARSGKRLDLLCTEPAPASRGRELDPVRGRAVRAVGKTLDRASAQSEFIGLAAFSAAGLQAVSDLCAGRDGRPGRFGEAPSMAQAGLTDLLAELIAAGVPVTAVEQDRGWLEIHDLADYRAAVEQLGGRLA